MADRRTVLVMNPQSHGGALRKQWADLGAIVRRELGAVEELRTTAPGDATRLTREALAGGARRVVAMGGDGTISEVASGFFRDSERAEHGCEPVAPDAELAIIPFGTGGDFRKTVNIPNDVARAARIAAGDTTRRIDVGRLAYTTREGAPAAQMFINIASFGISGLVDRLVNESSKRLGGRLSFALSTIRATFQYQNQRVRISFDDNPSDAVDMTIQTVVVANGRYFGGGMKMAPEAELDDGWFDVIAIGDVSRLEAMRHGYRIYRGTHLAIDKVSHRRARIVRAEPVRDEVVELDVDGETPGVLPATFSIVPRALSLVCRG